MIVVSRKAVSFRNAHVHTTVDHSVHSYVRQMSDEEVVLLIVLKFVVNCVLLTMAGWTNDETFEFIELYRKEACIWNPKHKHYKDKTMVNNAWIRIADTMGVPVTEVKKKKETLLAAFRLNHKKVLASRKSGAGEEEIFIPIWIYYDTLASFMSDVYECKPITTTHHVKDEDPLVGEPRPSQSSPSDEITVKIESEDATKTTVHSAIPEEKRRSHNLIDLQETNIQVKNTLSMLKNVLNDIKKNQCEDECDLYGKLLARKLRQFPETDRLDLMYEIDGILLKKRRST